MSALDSMSEWSEGAVLSDLRLGVDGLDAISTAVEPSANVAAILHELALHPEQEAELIQQLTAACSEQFSATREALSVLESMQREDRLSPELSQRIRLRLSEIAFNASGVYLGLTPERGLSPERGFSPEQSAFAAPASNAATVRVATAVEIFRSHPMRSWERIRRGMVLGERYRIVARAQMDTISHTFIAKDEHGETSGSDRSHVVLRCLQESAASRSDAVAAMQNEYALLQRIAYRNIPAAYEFLEVAEMPVIVLSYEAGRFLSDVIDGLHPRRLSKVHGLTLVREIAMTLAHAHARGVVHGNLHPGNVLITENGEVRIYGFAHADRWIASNHTAADTRYRAYRSPRRDAEGCARVHDDLYSLARIAQELLGEHCSRRNRAAIVQGLSSGAPRSCDAIRTWLNKLDVRQAVYSLPPLAEMIAAAK